MALADVFMKLVFNNNKINNLIIYNFISNMNIIQKGLQF